jgi:type II secretory pathway component PulF
MAVYRYQVIDEKGRSRTGSMPAENESALETKLAATGVWLLEAKPLKIPEAVDEAAKSKRDWFAPGIKRRDLIEFCTLMTFQCRVGIPLVQSLAIASQDCENRNFRRILQAVQREVEAGALFYEALERHPKFFPSQFTNVIRAGETSSKLPESFDDLRKYLEWVDTVMAEVRQASLYPAIVSMVVIAFVIGLFTFIIPKFAALLKATHAELPMLTQIIFGLSDGMRKTWWMWLIGFPLALITLMIARRVSRRVEMLVDRVKLSMPLFGEINTMLAISRFAHNLAILYRSGISIVQSLQMCRGLVGSALVGEAVGRVEVAVQSGSTISEAMRREPLLPPLLLRMVIMGETSGNLDAALDNVSQYYDDIIPRRIKKILTFLEPMLTLTMIFLVGCVALAIYLPIIALMGSIH